MKKFLVLLGLSYFAFINQAFIPNYGSNNNNGILKGRANSLISLESSSNGLRPADDQYYKLNMYNASETSYSTDYYASNEESQMIADRISYCEDWNHYKQWRKEDGIYVVYASGQCAAPAPDFLPAENDYAPNNSIPLALAR